MNFSSAIWDKSALVILLVLIYSKLHSISCDYLCKLKVLKNKDLTIKAKI